MPTASDLPPSPRQVRAANVGCCCVAPSAVLAAVALYVVFVVCFNDPPRLGAIPFDQAAWKAEFGAPDPNNPLSLSGSIRLLMVRSLLAQYHLADMTRSQVSDLLGPPNSTDGPSSAPRAIAYRLGHVAGGLRTEPAVRTLLLQLDRAGMVVGWDIVNR